MSEMKAKREPYLDVAKFVAMLTIVFIHVRTNAPNGEFGFVAGLDNFITAVVLGLFVLISGYLSRGLMASRNVAKLLRRQVVYIWPVFTMTLGLGGAIGCLVYGSWQIPGGSLLRYALSAGWFFFCMAICDLMTFAAHALARDNRKLLASLLLLQFACLWVVPVGLCHARDMILYFWFGLYAYPALLRLPYCRRLGLVSFALCLAVCVALPDFRTIGLFVHDSPMPVGTFSWRGCGLVAVKQALGLMGAFGTLEVVRLVTPRLKGVRFWSALGTQTLGVFFIHLLLIVAYYGWIGWMGWGVAGRFLLACAFFAAAHFLAVLSQANVVVRALLWNPLELARPKKKGDAP